MKIAYIARYAPYYIRCSKECNSLVSAGHEVTFIGWNMRPHEHKKHSMLLDVRLSILNYKSDFGKFQIKGWCLWCYHLLRNLWTKDFDVIHCVDEYPVLMLLPFKHLFYRKIVLDVYDSIIKRETKSFIIHYIFHILRFIANFYSDRIIETSDKLKGTLGIFRKKAIVIYNSPIDPIDSIEGIFPEQDAPIRIAATGAIHSKSMALHTLLRALNLFRSGRIEVICTGILIDSYARETFVKHPAVKYQWIEKQEDYYKTLAMCDLIYNVRVDAQNSFYRSLVFPNKIFDALAVGRPVLVATENWVSCWVEDKEVGFSCPFEDEYKMREIFESCLDHRKVLINFSRKARKLFKEMYDWRIMEERLIKLYMDL